MIHLSDLKENPLSLLDQDLYLEGKIFIKNTTHLAGHIKGDIAMTPEAHLIIEPSGKIEGNITGGKISVWGIICGNVDVISFTALEGAHLSGTLKAQELHVEAGAVLNLNLNIESSS
ncbi:MAG: polymer-forming cytoskeletal protein [Bacteriovoracaceae bacterium]|nr:polymer-forming cytoskeletal protein [Bacteriovoracaceae bacterium]